MKICIDRKTGLSFLTQPVRQMLHKMSSFKIYRVPHLEICASRRSQLSKSLYMMESLILAQDERWRRGLGMQVERYGIFGYQRVANG